MHYTVKISIPIRTQPTKSSKIKGLHPHTPLLSKKEHLGANAVAKDT